MSALSHTILSYYTLPKFTIVSYSISCQTIAYHTLFMWAIAPLATSLRSLQETELQQPRAGTSPAGRRPQLPSLSTSQADIDRDVNMDTDIDVDMDIDIEANIDT